MQPTTCTISSIEKAVLEREGIQMCRECGSPNMQPNGACRVCRDCGTTTGCS